MPAWRTRRSLYDCHVATIAAQALIQVSCGTRPASMSISISYGSVQDNSSVLSETTTNENFPFFILNVESQCR